MSPAILGDSARTISKTQERERLGYSIKKMSVNIYLTVNFDVF